MYDEEEKTDHLSEDERVHITRAYTTALMFEQNIKIALGEMDINTTPLHKVDPRPSTEPKKRIFTRECKYQKCLKMFETIHSRVKFCSKQCCVYHHKEQYETRKKKNPVKYAEMKRQKNIAWGRYNTGWAKSPPVQRGKPTASKKERLTEFRNRLKRIGEETRWKKRSLTNISTTTSQQGGDDAAK